MSESDVRRRFRRAIPRRVRMALRMLYRLGSGYYIHSFSQLKDIQSELEAHRESDRDQQQMVDLLLKRLQHLEDEVLQLRSGPGPRNESTPGERTSILPAENESEPADLRVSIVCRSWGRRCGVAEYAGFLSERLNAPVVASAADLSLDTDVVFLQYEPGFYSPEDLLNELRIIRPSVIPVVDAHYITPEFALELSQHAIVGTKRDVHPGTVRLAHIQQVPIPIEDEPVDRLRLGSFGFAFPPKRYEMIIDLATRLGIPATILASHNNATDWQGELSATYLAQLKAQGGEGVDIVDDFLPVDEVIRRLRKCSHLVSCMEDNGAQSGSLRIMASTGRPLISLRTAQAEEVGAILVDTLDDVTPEFLANCTGRPNPYDGIEDYHNLLDHLRQARRRGDGIRNGSWKVAPR